MSSQPGLNKEYRGPAYSTSALASPDDLESGTAPDSIPSKLELDNDDVVAQQSRFRAASTVTMTPELFEKLYLSPKTAVAGDLRQRFANPTPLALAGHILCICPLGCNLIGWKGSGGSGAASTGGYVFVGGLLLFTAGLLEFFLGNTFPFVVFCAFAGFWFSFAATLIPSFNAYGAYAASSESAASGISTQGFEASFGFYLLFWTVFVMILLVCSLRTNFCFFFLFFTLEFCFICLTVGYFRLSEASAVSGSKLVQAGGGFALACGLTGFYIFLSLMLVAVDFPYLLPVGDISHLMVGYQERRQNTN
ncbi:GPR1/FUN34/yaaH family-domain-containing protein [Myxozyma melibiosi]|uniref:GPR1/FUN34/yaaH family-domain-containing protein n=1 Tax=Myxozyma melibiosi TaxID=54550 RepID=A0ABR1F3A1_9ASCO